MKRFAILAALTVAVTAFVWMQSGNRFRLTVEVLTPERLKTGSSVIETTFWESGGLPEARGLKARAEGEAVFVDLGNGRNLLALLAWGKLGENEDQIFGLRRAALGRGSDIGWQAEHKLRGRAELAPEYFPTLITFDDLNNPATARVVDPVGLAEAYGPGYALRRIILETTNDQVTKTIERKLPWWSSSGRPASVARRAWLAGKTIGVSQEPERLFRKD